MGPHYLRRMLSIFILSFPLAELTVGQVPKNCFTFPRCLHQNYLCFQIIRVLVSHSRVTNPSPVDSRGHLDFQALSDTVATGTNDDLAIGQVPFPALVVGSRSFRSSCWRVLRGSAEGRRERQALSTSQPSTRPGGGSLHTLLTEGATAVLLSIMESLTGTRSTLKNHSPTGKERPQERIMH